MEIDITDLTDEESFSFQNDNFSQDDSEIHIISSDEDLNNSELLTVDELPDVELQQKKSSAIRSLFTGNRNNGTFDKNNVYSVKSNGHTKDGKYMADETEENLKPLASTSKYVESKKEVWKPQSKVEKPQVEVPQPQVPSFTRMIEGVSVNLPVQPYGSQVALMSMLIKGIKRNQNCLLESPTGSGKTLALLCGALGWLTSEKKIIAQQQAQNYFSSHPVLKNVDGAMDYVTSPQKKTNSETPQKMFTKVNFGEKSIYDNNTNGKSNHGQVTIHKRKIIDSTDENSKPKRLTPEKKDPQENENPQRIQELLDNIHIRIRMCTNSSAPKIYYGARTHKQLQQVIKEFKRTVYCGTKEVTMSLLSSREYSCIREYDKAQWPTKNDMCAGCIKRVTRKKDGLKSVGDTNCQFYDNYRALNHSRLPPAFDLEDLVRAGNELKACPYFAAREVAKTADIVFCPYNYLIEPTIRSSMGIDLNNNILIIDEAHNIEDICRDSASFTITMESVRSALEELENAAKYRYENEDAMSYIDYLIRVLKEWEYWFVNQIKLLEGLPFNNNEAVYDKWPVETFAKTLDNYNIGLKDFFVFKENAQMFCTKLRDDPDILYGVTQATGTLLESIAIALGYLFREDGKYMDDFKPALIKTVNNNWNGSFIRKPAKEESISLKLICMNPAVVFDSLKVARCIVLASGTLTPLISLHSELNTEFPIQVSPSHVIPSDRVWIGTLTSHRDGRALECKSRDTNQIDTQDTLGDAVLWVCKVTPHGVLCFVPSYQLLNKLVNRWIQTGVWRKLNELKNVFQESRNVKDHNEVMNEYYDSVSTDKGAILFAVYRGKVSEGMDFKDHQARAVITIGVPYPNTFDRSVKAKMDYNDKYAKERKLLTGSNWLQIQAYRALNQAVGRCVRHKGDWGAVLMIDSRFQSSAYTEHLSKWLVQFLDKNHHTFQSLIHSPNSLESFMQNMTIREKEDL